MRQSEGKTLHESWMNCSTVARKQISLRGRSSWWHARAVCCPETSGACNPDRWLHVCDVTDSHGRCKCPWVQVPRKMAAVRMCACVISRETRSHKIVPLVGWVGRNGQQEFGGGGGGFGRLNEIASQATTEEQKPRLCTWRRQSQRQSTDFERRKWRRHVSGALTPVLEVRGSL